MKKSCAFWFGLAVLLVITGCDKAAHKTDNPLASNSSASPTVPRTTPGTFTDVYTNTLSTCTQCHVPGGAASQVNHVKLDFTTQATAYRTVTQGVVSGITSAQICKNVKIVVAGSPVSSYLAAVLFPDYDKDDFVIAGCTPYSLHHQDQNLSVDEKNSMIEWIQNGAKNN